MADRVISYEFRAKFDQFKASLAAGSQSVSDFAGELTALDEGGQEAREALSAFGETAGKIGAVAGAGLGAAVAASMKFEKAMSAVQSATHESSENMDLLSEAALKAGADTVFSATESAGAIEELAKAGVSTQDILGGGLTGSLSLAAAGELEVADAAEIAATALTQFKLEGSDVEHVADLLAAGAGKAQGSVDDMGMALKQSGLVASQTGLTIEETTGTLAAFASAGLIGSDAGTSFKTMLQSLTPSSKEAKDLMEALGISAYDAQGNFIGMTEFAGVLRGALQNLSVEQQNAAMKTIFGSDAVRAASVIYSQGAAGIQEWIDKTNDAGYAAETAATRLDNLAGDWEAFTGSVETALIKIGDGSQGPLRGLVQQATDLVNAFNEAPPIIHDTVGALLAITAVTGGAAFFGAKIVQNIADTRLSLQNLGVTAKASSTNLAAVGKTAGRLVAVAAAVSLLGEAVQKVSGAELDGADLQRNLEAIALGNDSDVIKRTSEDIDLLSNSINTAAEPIAEAGRLFGLLGDTGLDTAAANIEQVDQALAAMVEGGEADKAAEIFNRLMAAATGLPEGSSFSPGVGEAADKFDAYGIALDNAATAAGQAADANAEVGGASQKAGQDALEAAEKQKAAAAALKKVREQARETAGQFFGLGDSLNKAKVSLGGWIRDLEDQADALRNFRKNAQEAADKGVRAGLIAALQEAGPEGARRMRQLSNATEAEIGRANKAWAAGQREIDRYVNAVDGVPSVKATDLRANADSATAEARRLKRELDSIPREIRTTYYVNTLRRVTLQNLPGGRDGDPNTPYASGGYTGPGDKYEPAGIVHRGEVVIPQELVKRDWSMLSSRYGHLPGFADGGRVGGDGDKKKDPRFGFSLDVDVLKDRLRSLSQELAASERALSRETAQRDDLIQQQQQIRSSVAAGLNQDLWAAGNPWAAGAGMDPTGKARAVAATANEFTRLVKSLRAKGLDGPALAEAAASGDIDRLRFLASLSPRDLKSYEKAIERMESAVRAAGQATTGALGIDAAAAAAEAQVKALQAQTKEQGRMIKQLEKTIERTAAAIPKGVGREINGAGSRGQRNRRRDGK